MAYIEPRITATAAIQVSMVVTGITSIKKTGLKTVNITRIIMYAATLVIKGAIRPLTVDGASA